MIRKSLIYLTLQYTILLLGLFFVFNASIYIYMVHTFDTDYNQTVYSAGERYKTNSKIAADNGAEEATDAGIARLRSALIISYCGLIVLVPFISYILARRSLKPVIQSYNAQRQFVDNASHELRTPLSRVQGELELALNIKRSPKEYRNAINISLLELENIGTLISNLLLLARGTSKEIEGSLHDVEIQKAINKALEAVSITYSSSMPEVVNKVRRRPIIVTAMPTLLEQALINILDNSVKSTDISGKIVIDAAVDSQRVTLRISDNGKGMTKHEIEHAFDRLWRADSKSDTGQGLGLPFAKQVIEAHRGSALILPNKNRGIIFEIILPLSI